MKYAAILLACICTPVYAASTVEIPCETDDSPIADHDLPARVELLISESLDAESEISVEESDDTAEEVVIRDVVDRSLPLDLPGDEAALYKRKMYRTDI